MSEQRERRKHPRTRLINSEPDFTGGALAFHSDAFSMAVAPLDDPAPAPAPDPAPDFSGFDGGTSGGGGASGDF